MISSGEIIGSIPRGSNTNKLGNPSKFSPISKAKGDVKRNFTKQQKLKISNKPTSSKSTGSIFADAFRVEANFPARPGLNRYGLLGRFSAQPTPDPYNPGCARGPRSIVVLSGQVGPAPRITPKLQENPPNRNNLGQGSCRAKQNNQDGTLIREQRRNLPSPDNLVISEQNVIIRDGQARYKIINHGHELEIEST